VADLDCEDGHGEAVLGETAATIHEIISSGMFALDVGPDIADAEKLRYVCDALDPHAAWTGKTGSAWVGSGNRGAGNASEPYIVVPHGDDFADSFDARFCEGSTLVGLQLMGTQPPPEFGTDSYKGRPTHLTTMHQLNSDSLYAPLMVQHATMHVL